MIILVLQPICRTTYNSALTMKKHEMLRIS